MAPRKRSSSSKESKSSKPQGQKRSDMIYDYDGDLTLISSDEVVVKLKRFHLQATSPIFRDTIEIGTGQSRIELLDDRIETSTVLTAVFAMLFEGKTCMVPVEVFKDLIGFLRKYEIKFLVSHCKLQLESGLLNDAKAHEVLIRGAIMDEHGICAKVIRRMGQHIWPDAASGNWAGAVPNGAGLDLRTMDFRHLALMPLATTWALLRAGYISSTGGNINAQVMREEYSRLMEHADAPKSL